MGIILHKAPYRKAALEALEGLVKRHKLERERLPATLSMYLSLPKLLSYAFIAEYFEEEFSLDDYPNLKKLYSIDAIEE